MNKTVRNRLGPIDHSKSALRLWLRLLSCSTTIENQVRKGLAQEFDTTLPRFDFAAALYRFPEGLTMSEVAEKLMVTKGNITSIADHLEKNGIIKRTVQKMDRRSQIVKLTKKGIQQFEERAGVHEQWINSWFDELSTEEMEALTTALTKLQHSVEQNHQD